MSYNTLHDLAYDHDIQRRATACAAMEKIPDPVPWVSQRNWELATQPGWNAAYATALESNIPTPGKDESVITDSMILAAVQSLRSTP